MNSCLFTRSPRRRYSRNGTLWNIDSGSASLRLDVEGPDDVAPLLRFVGDELAEVGGRTRKYRAAEVSEPRFHFWVGESGVDLLVECVDDLGGLVPGCAEADLRTRFVAGDKIVYGWDIGQPLPARCCRHR